MDIEDDVDMDPMGNTIGFHQVYVSWMSFSVMVKGSEGYMRMSQQADESEIDERARWTCRTTTRVVLAPGFVLRSPLDQEKSCMRFVSAQKLTSRPPSSSLLLLDCYMCIIR